MSRNHLQFVRDAGSGNGEDWRQISWLVVDLNGMCGTYINLNKIEANKSRVLNNGDLVGVGCPDQESSKSEAIEKFVFGIRAPEAYRVAPLTTDPPTQLTSLLILTKNSQRYKLKSQCCL